MAIEQAQKEEEVREQEWLAEEARVRAEEEAHAREEVERLTMEQSLWEVEGSSKRKAPW